MRSIEFGEMRVELQDYLKELLNLPKQTVVQYGRFNVPGATTKGREIREQIEFGQLSGWDDPRLVTIQSLRRRGIQPDTFKELALEVGLSTTPTNIDWSVIASFNRKRLDSVCNRYFFVPNPKKIVVDRTPSKTLQVKLHPDHAERGNRTFTITNEFYIAENDLEAVAKKDLNRLMDCVNFRKAGKNFLFDSFEYEKFKESGKRTMQWVPVNDNVKVEVLMSDASIKKGLAETGVKKLKIGEIVQFVRFGFCKLEKKEKNKWVFIYTHD